MISRLLAGGAAVLALSVGAGQALAQAASAHAGASAAPATTEGTTQGTVAASPRGAAAKPPPGHRAGDPVTSTLGHTGGLIGSTVGGNLSKGGALIGGTVGGALGVGRHKDPPRCRSYEGCSPGGWLRSWCCEAPTLAGGPTG